MNYRNIPPEEWLLCAKWICAIMNMTAEKSLGWRTPLEVLTGETTDISIALIFLYGDAVYCSRQKDSKFSGQLGSKKSDEIRGRFVGFADNVGHALTFKILTDDTKRIINRSRVRLANTPENNSKLDIEAGVAPERIYIKTKWDDIDEKKVRLPTIDLTVNPFAIDRTDVTEGPENSNAPDVLSETPHQDKPTVETVEQGTTPKIVNADAVNLFPEKDSKQDEAPERRSAMDGTPLKEMETAPPPDDDELSPHLRTEGINEDTTTPNVDFVTDSLKTDASRPPVPNLPPEELIDRTFLMPPQSDASQKPFLTCCSEFRANVINPFGRPHL
jgi:hypothetical protein